MPNSEKYAQIEEQIAKRIPKPDQLLDPAEASKRLAASLEDIRAIEAEQRARYNIPEPTGEGENHMSHTNGHEAQKKEKLIFKTDAEVKAFLEKRPVVWMKLKEIIENLFKLMCVDGRNEEPAIATPAGSTGEVLLALTTMEEMLGRPLTDTEIFTLFDEVVEKFGGLYMHSDGHAFEHAYEALAADARFDGILEKTDDHHGQIESVLKLVNNPGADQTIRQALLEVLLNNLGCGHIKLMLNKEGYEVRPELIRAFHQAFFTKMWNGDTRLRFHQLDHNHAEGAVVNVTVPGNENGEIDLDTLIPLFPPHAIGEAQVFVNHPQVVEYVRKLLREFLGERLTAMTQHQFDSAQVAERQAGLGLQQLKETLIHLAPDLGVFTSVFTQDGPGHTIQVDKNFDVADLKKAS